MTDNKTQRNKSVGAANEQESDDLQQSVLSIRHKTCKAETIDTIQRIKDGEVDPASLDYIPLYSPVNWDSREQYERLVANKVDQLL